MTLPTVLMLYRVFHLLPSDVLRKGGSWETLRPFIEPAGRGWWKPSRKLCGALGKPLDRARDKVSQAAAYHRLVALWAFAGEEKQIVPWSQARVILATEGLPERIPGLFWLRGEMLCRIYAPAFTATLDAIRKGLESISVTLSVNDAAKEMRQNHRLGIVLLLPCQEKKQRLMRYMRELHPGVLSAIRLVVEVLEADEAGVEE